MSFPSGDLHGIREGIRDRRQGNQQEWEQVHFMFCIMVWWGEKNR